MNVFDHITDAPSGSNTLRSYNILMDVTFRLMESSTQRTNIVSE